MKTFKELKITGTKEDLQKIVEDILRFSRQDVWKIQKTDDGLGSSYIRFEYVGKELDRATAYIFLGDFSKSLSIGTIVPIEKSELNFDEYNNLLQSLYDNVLQLFNGKKGIQVELYGGEINLGNELSNESNEKLKTFVVCANPSTGSVHPNDKERWLDFVVQTFIDKCIIDAWHLERFLVEERNWPKDVATDLAIEYENDIELLKYYARKIGKTDE